MSGEEIRQRVVDRLRALGLEGEEPAVLLAHFLGVSAPPPVPQSSLGSPAQGADVRRASRPLPPREPGSADRRWSSRTSTGSIRAPRSSSSTSRRRLAGHRVLLVLSGRPGFAPPWLAALAADTITLQGLDGERDPRHDRALLVRANALAAPLVEILVDKSEGNPLYVEEILRAAPGDRRDRRGEW